MSDMSERISRREFLSRSAAAAGVAAAGVSWCGSAFADEQSPRPNILFILTDDQRWDAMSCMGHPFLATPNMDRIAGEGALFSNAFVTTSLCSPSRASFLTGAYAHRHGVVTNEANDPDPALPTFPQLLQRAGYETAFIGKWHMARKAGPRPGFDYWLSFVGQGQYENPKLNENGRDFQAEGYMTDLLTNHAVNWLKRAREKPFCLVLSHKAVHGPFTPAPRHREAFGDVDMAEPANFNDRYEGKPEWYRRISTYGARKARWIQSEGKPVPPALEPGKWESRAKARIDYYRALLAVDEGIGRVFEALESTGEMDSTVIVFAGDNGFFHGEHRRGDKRLIYEESIRIPFLMRYPKIVKPGSRVSGMALNIDLAPTLLDLAGVAVPATMQGRSLLPLLQGRSVRWRQSFLYEYFREEWLPGIPLMLGVRTPRWKYARYPDIADIEELYDLKDDPGELRNLAQDPSYEGRVEEMRRELQRLKEQTAYPEGKQLGAPPVVVPETRADKPDEAVLAFDFTHGAADRAADLSGRGHHGVLHGARFVEEEGKRALRLDGEGFVEVPHSETLDPSRGPWTVEARVKSERPDGIILAQGGKSHGYVLFLKNRRPHFAVRVDAEPFEVAAENPVGSGWVHLAGVIGRDRALKLYVDGSPVGESTEAGFISENPHERLEIGTDAGTLVGTYDAPSPFVGLIDSVRIWAGERTTEHIAQDARPPRY